RGMFRLDASTKGPILVVHPRVALHPILLQPGDGVIEVEPAVPLNGKVVNAKGVGVGGARIFLDSVPTAVSAGDGSFTIERAPRRYRTLSAQAGGLARRVARTVGAPIIRLVQPLSVRGIVRDAARRPPRGAAGTRLSGDGDEAARTPARGPSAVQALRGHHEWAG